MTDFAQLREESYRRAVARFGLPVPEESVRRAVARKEAFIRQLLGEADVLEIEDVEPGELSYTEIRRAASAPEMLQIVLTPARSRLGLYGLALTDLPAEVHAFVRMVADMLEVRPGSSFLFVQSAEQCGLPEGAYGLCSEGVRSPFTWWMDTAVLDGRVRVPAGWRIKGTDSPCVMGIYPV